MCREEPFFPTPWNLSQRLVAFVIWGHCFFFVFYWGGGVAETEFQFGNPCFIQLPGWDTFGGQEALNWSFGVGRTPKVLFTPNCLTLQRLTTQQLFWNHTSFIHCEFHTTKLTATVDSFGTQRNSSRERKPNWTDRLSQSVDSVKQNSVSLMHVSWQQTWQRIRWCLYIREQGTCICLIVTGWVVVAVVAVWVTFRQKQLRCLPNPWSIECIQHHFLAKRTNLPLSLRCTFCWNGERVSATAKMLSETFSNWEFAKNHGQEKINFEPVDTLKNIFLRQSQNNR